MPIDMKSLMIGMTIPNWNVAKTGAAPADAPWTPPADWINIDNVIDGNINLLVADSGLATYAFICTTSIGTYHVDWGDGTSNDYNSATKAQKTYTVGTGQACSRGYTTFKIVISPNTGNLTRFYVQDHTLAAIHQGQHYLDCVWGARAVTSMANAFHDATGIFVYCRVLERFKHVGVQTEISISASYMFYYCYSLQSVDVSGMTAVINATSMFCYCYNLRSVNASGLTAVTTATTMFYYCYSLQSVDVSGMTAVINATYMFCYCHSLRSVNASGLAAVTDASGMFGYCYSLQSVNLSGMTAVTNATNMFNGCSALQSVDVSSMTAVKTATTMFNRCTSLQNVDVSSMTAVTNASSMFCYCYSLQSVNASGLAAVTDASGMFYCCYSLQSVNLSGMTAVTTASSMFSDCYNLHRIDISGMAAVTNATYMFYCCSSLQSVNASGMSAVTDATYMFYNCYSLQVLASTNFGFYAVGVGCSSMFYCCEQLTSINLPKAKMTSLGATGSAGRPNKLATLTYHPSSPFSGLSPQIDISYCTLTAAQLNTIFTDLPTMAKTIKITGCTGAATCDKTIATAKGWTVTG